MGGQTHDQERNPSRGLHAVIFLVLAAVSPIDSPEGCFSTGATVYCKLAPPAPASPKAPVALIRTPGKNLVRLKRPERQLSHIISNQAGKQGALNEADISRHVAALVAIEDCTGARNFANGLGATELAQRTFATCIGLKPKLAQGGDIADAK